MPTLIWMTPTTIEIFILYELKKVILFCVLCHSGSIPIGYGLVGYPPAGSVSPSKAAIWHDAWSERQKLGDAVPNWSSYWYQREPPNQFIGKANASLYIMPTYAPNNPLSRMMYRPPYIIASMSFIFCPSKSFSFLIRKPPSAARSSPCPKSPNMMPKRKGKRMTAKAPGLASRYRGVPYVLTSAWKPEVKRVVGTNVGGVRRESNRLRIGLSSRPRSSFTSWRAASTWRGGRGR